MTCHPPFAQGTAPRRAALSRHVCHWLGQCKVAAVFKHWQSQWHASAVNLPLPLGEGRGDGELPDNSIHAIDSNTKTLTLPSPKGRGFFSSRRRARGFTLIEILVSLTITMMMMGAVVTLFGVMSDSVSGSRSIIEMSERLRACRNRLQADLQGVTVGISAGGLQPPLRPENDEGYFEYIEGPDVDTNYAAALTNQLDTVTNKPIDTNSIFGDADDVLMFTVRSTGEPFVGRTNITAAGTIESQVAEVMYFAVRNGPTIFTPVFTSMGTPPTITPFQLYTLYRRVLLVAPVVGNRPQAELAAWYDNNDISVRFQQTSTTATTIAALTFIGVPNTLGDLTKRESRFAHFGTVFPTPPAMPPPPPSSLAATFPFNVSNATPTNWPAALPSTFNTPPNNPAALTALAGTRFADDVLMTNVLAFDVQVYDSNAPIKLSNTNPTHLVFSDAAFGLGPGVTTLQTGGINGAYVNLGYGATDPAGGPSPFFSAPRSRAVTAAPTNPVTLLPALPLPTVLAGLSFTYDTWSLHYENDGQPQPSTATTFDLGTNGLDDVIPPATVSNGIVDDPTEFDTQPPFAAPLRGIRVVIRAYEPGSQQVREVTVVQDFLPE